MDEVASQGGVQKYALSLLHTTAHGYYMANTEIPVLNVECQA
jgi:hypothetical protein